MINELCTKGAAELAAMIRAREVSSAEVVDAHLSRIDEMNPTINAVTVILADGARAAATETDRAIAAGREVGVLAGVPFTIKENIDVEGTATTWGTAALSEQVSPSDAPVVARLREAGAIPMARTNLPDLAFRWDTESARAGRTLNPWDDTRAVGGSSGGDAAALATGMTPLGVGNDLGGSLRVPAQMCGITSLRPGFGRVAHSAATQPWPEPHVFQATNCQGPMARHVADLRLALGVMAGRDVRDPRWTEGPLSGLVESSPTRVALVRDPGGLGVDPQVQAGVDRAAAWLSDSGYDVVEAEPPNIAEVSQLWFDAIWADIGPMWPHLEPIVGPRQVDFVAACIAQGVLRPVDQNAQRETWMAIAAQAAAWSSFLDEFPVVLAPVCCERPWRVGDDITRVAQIAEAMRMLVSVNILGLPSCVVPVGSDEGLPQGVQLIGARFSEERLLDAAEQIERHVPALTPIQPRVAALV